MNRVKNSLFISLVLFFGTNPKVLAVSELGQAGGPLRVYEVNKKVCDFPDSNDFSTPEAAYAVINRLVATGNQSKWRQASVKQLTDRLPPPDAEVRKVPPEEANMWLDANILEVRIFKGRYAVVIAKLLHEGKPARFDRRAIHLEDGKWLNVGQDIYDSLDKARVCVEAWAEYADKPVRPEVDDPESYLKPFVAFLKTNGEEPKKFIIKALSKYKVVIIGETHHRPLYWAFNSSLVTDREFVKNVGTIHMELPSNDQELVDKFLSGQDCNTTPIIEMLRDIFEMGWPDQPMLDFFTTVWMVNQNLEHKQQLRIVLVDMERPWGKIQKKEELQNYDVNRDEFMADNIIKDLHRHPEEKRNALFIVGMGHTGLNLKFFEGSPVQTAGWHLRRNLGDDKIYAIFQHRCVQPNIGLPKGRLCLGLFESAFAEVGNKPMAFTLEEGPLGEQPYDADPETPIASTYRDGFNAYLYLGPLETESFSPLIAGFYTDEFVKEIERRHQIMFGKGWAEKYGQNKSDADTFINWMSSNWWGKPRREWQKDTLGPMDAWKYGDNWKEEIRKVNFDIAFEHPEVITNTAKKLFNAIRNADYERYSDGKDWQYFFTNDLDYQVNHYADEWVRWICKTFKNNPIESVELGKVFKHQSGRPAIPYKLTLKDGTILEGNLPFDYNPQRQIWYGVEGIDWHLQSKKP